MNRRRSWKSTCVEAGPCTKSSEVLRHRVGLPRHRAVDVVGEHVGVRQRARLGRAQRAPRACDLGPEHRQRQLVEGHDPLAAVLRRDLLQRDVLEDDDRRRHLEQASIPVDITLSAQRTQLGPPQPGRGGDEDRPGVLRPPATARPPRSAGGHRRVSARPVRRSGSTVARPTAPGSCRANPTGRPG